MPKKPLRLPILKMGEFHHPKLGKLNIDQPLIDSVIAHTRGYEPYLRYGHNSKGAGLHGGEPQQGLLKKYEQDGDVLYGIFEPRTEKVVQEVKDKEYRYGSAELVLNALDQKTGLRVPAVLKGHSLTNEPFIPDLPENQVLEGEVLLADTESRSFSVTVLLADYTGEDDQLGKPFCTVCGDTLDSEERDANDWGNGLCAECLKLTESRRNPEKTMFQKLAAMIGDMRSSVSSLTWRIDDLTWKQNAAASPSTALFTDEQAPPADADPAAPPSDDTPPAPPAGASTQENPPVMTPEEIEKLQADLAAEKAAKEAAEKAAADAKAALEAKEAAEKEAADKAAADAETARLAAEQAAKEAAETQFEANLTDLAEKKVAAGALPARVEQAIQLVRAHKAMTDSTTVCLTDGAEPTDFAASVFALLSDNLVDFAQAGKGGEANLTDAPPAAAGTAPGGTTPWATQLQRVREQRAALQAQGA